jgi:iron complex outermembrane receptor protein
MRSLMLAVAVSPALAASAATQEPDSTRPDTVVVLSEIVVRAATPITTVGGASAVRTRIDSLSVPPAPTIEQVFRAMPMMHVRRNSRGEAELSVRGSDSRQVAVLVDGVPLTLAWDGRADVSVIPASAPQEIEFVRGLSSMLYGPNVLGGVVELNVGTSLLQPQSASLEVGSEIDHVGGYRVGGAAVLPLAPDNGRWLLRAGASHYSTPGQPLARGVSEPIATDRSLRLNTDATSVDAFAALRYFNFGGEWFSFSGSTFLADRGIPAELGVPDEDARLWRYPRVARTVLVASGGSGDRATPLGNGDLEASVGLDIGRTEIDEYTSRTYGETSGEFENGDDRTLTLRLLGDHTLGRRGDLRAAFTLSDIRHDELLPSEEARYRQQLMSIGAETVWRLIEADGAVRYLRVTAGAAYDVGKTPESGGRAPLSTLNEWGGRMGATLGVSGGNTVIHAGVSRRARFPSLRELYSGALNRFVPNPDLRPEILVALEGGVTLRLGSSELQAVGFHHRLKDAVVRTHLPDGRYFRVNRDRLTSTGVELLASSRVGPVEVGGDATLQTVDLTDPLAGITNRPENLPEVFGSVHAAVPLPFQIRGFAEVRHTGSQYCIDPSTGEDVELEAGTIVNANVARTWPLRSSGGPLRNLETSVAVDNAGDVALYDQCGLPRPGRLMRFQVKVY